MDEKDRLLRVMEIEGFTSAQFADKIGVNRATISHIVNGRNAPSLDVLKRTLKVIRTISPDWLVLGVGPIYRETLTQQGTLFDMPAELPSTEQNVTMGKDNGEKKIENLPTSTCDNTKKISKIIVFYTDNSFEEVLPR